MIICDEPVSALDLSVQAQVLNLLNDLQQQLQISYIFISHDLSVVRHVADRVAVMYLGRIVETGPTEAVYDRANHPYTAALMSAAPKLDAAQRGNRILLKGEVPSPLNPPSGCRFRTRCWKATEVCATQAPPVAVDPQVNDHSAECHHPLQAGTGWRGVGLGVSLASYCDSRRRRSSWRRACRRRSDSAWACWPLLSWRSSIRV